MSTTRHWMLEPLIYGLGAGVAFMVDLAVLWTLVERFGVHYLIAATVSFLAGTAVVYLVSVRHAFKHRSVEDRRAEFAVFAAIGAAGIALNVGIIAALVEYLGVHYIAAKVCASATTFVANFVARKALLFTPRSRPVRATPLAERTRE